MNVTALQRRFSSLLRPASAVYAALMRLREQRYALRRIAAPYRPGCPVISVGNIAWGGSGKTPLVDYLLSWAETLGLNAVVLTRGYKASPPAHPFSVSPGDDPTEAGDGPLLLSRRHPQCLVLVDPMRSRAAAWAEQNAKPQLFILDDGMQHLAVQRDLDLVLLRPEDLLDQWNTVIPAGSWREGASALKRAHAFCIKLDPARFHLLAPVAEKRLAPFDKPFFSFQLAPVGFTRLRAQSRDEQSCQTDLGGAPYLLASGVGNPAQLRDSVSSFLGMPPEKHVPFKDHHSFSAEDAKALAAHGLPLVCTAKDAVKLVDFLPHFKNTPVWVFEVRVEFGPSLFTRYSFPQWLDYEWRRISAGYPPAVPPAPTHSEEFSA